MLSEDIVLLRGIWSMTARQVFSVDSLTEIVGSGEKQRRAFNMCDGTKTQGEIAKSTKIDPGNFSKTLARWIEAGVVLRLGEGRESKFLYVYPLYAAKPKRARINQ